MSIHYDIVFQRNNHSFCPRPVTSLTTAHVRLHMPTRWTSGEIHGELHPGAKSAPVLLERMMDMRVAVRFEQQIYNRCFRYLQIHFALSTPATLKSTSFTQFPEYVPLLGQTLGIRNHYASPKA